MVLLAHAANQSINHKIWCSLGVLHKRKETSAIESRRSVNCPKEFLPEIQYSEREFSICIASRCAYTQTLQLNEEYWKADDASTSASPV